MHARLAIIPVRYAGMQSAVNVSEGYALKRQASSRNFNGAGFKGCQKVTPSVTWASGDESLVDVPGLFHPAWGKKDRPVMLGRPIGVIRVNSGVGQVWF